MRKAPGSWPSLQCTPSAPQAQPPLRLLDSGPPEPQPTSPPPPLLQSSQLSSATLKPHPPTRSPFPAQELGGTSADFPLCPLSVSYPPERCTQSPQRLWLVCLQQRLPPYYRQDREHGGGSREVAGGAFPGEGETCFLGGDLGGRRISEGFGGRAAV